MASTREATKEIRRENKRGNGRWILTDYYFRAFFVTFILQYTQLLVAFDYLVSLPSSSVEEKFIMQYREPLAATTQSRLFGPDIPEVTIDPVTQRRQATVKTRCKDTKTEVTVMDAGTGKFDIDGHDLPTFRHLIARYDLSIKFIIFIEKLCKWIAR
ncbi:unnamed protein product [Cylicostephanus goldi]|uniref:Uncharacterized protein n=1 Tax=Cylicostephanus goldi TaxID=71465 RepID=A0A3P6R0V2_CYLGO|nr:unnamed protein product [Cylicostephanus goldi]